MDTTYEDFEYSEPEDVLLEEDEDDDWVCPPLVEIGQAKPPRHPDGTFIVTPRVLAKMRPGELEMYYGGLGRKLRYYAWSMASSRSEVDVDPEGLVQDALFERFNDPRKLAVEDRERFAIRAIRFAIGKVDRQAKFKSETDSADVVLEAAEFVTSVFPDVVVSWMSEHVSVKVQEALRLMFEEQYTQEEAAAEVGRTPEAIRQATVKLRGVIDQYPRAH